MKLGINIRNFGPSADPENLRGWAHFAERSGFAIAMMSDHVAATPDVSAIYPEPFYEPFATLAWLGGITERIELGTTVTVLPYRNPLLTARMGACIDRFTGGRFVLGVGIGWSEPEFTALGVPFNRRGRITSEYLAAITALWTKDIASYEGEFVSFRDVSTGPSSVRKPHPPIWVGASGPAGIRRAAQYGDAWHPINETAAWLRAQGIPQLRAAAEELGRSAPAVCPRIQLRRTDEPVDRPDRPAGEGTLAQIHADIEEFRDLGCDYLILDTNPDDPHDRRSPTVDQELLAAAAECILG